MSKYNAKKVTIDGFQFDSKAEAQYYEHLKGRAERREVASFSLQPRFLLQEAFRKNGVLHRKIEYVADFEIVHMDGSIEIVDVKGMETSDFKIKRKLFEKKYPYTLSLLKYVKKFGGWITTDEWKAKKRQEKKHAKSSLESRV